MSDPAEQVRWLEAERDRLLSRIVELDHDHDEGELDDESHRALREDYVARAAAVLRQLQRDRQLQDRADQRPLHSDESEPARPEGVGEAARAARAARESPHPRGDSLRGRDEDEVSQFGPGGFLGGAGLLGGALALAVTLLLGLAAVSGGAVQGSAAGAASTAGAAGSQPLAISAQLYRARTLENQGKEVEALQIFQQVLQLQPHNAEALAYQGWLLRQAALSSGNASLASEGRASLRAAVSADPTYPDAHALLGYVLFEDEHDPAGAVEQFKMFLADHPPAELVQLTSSVVDQAFAAVGEPVPPATSPSRSG